MWLSRHLLRAYSPKAHRGQAPCGGGRGAGVHDHHGARTWSQTSKERRCHHRQPSPCRAHARQGLRHHAVGDPFRTDRPTAAFFLRPPALQECPLPCPGSPPLRRPQLLVQVLSAASPITPCLPREHPSFAPHCDCRRPRPSLHPHDALPGWTRTSGWDGSRLAPSGGAPHMSLSL